MCIIESESLTEVNLNYAHFLRLLEKPCSIQGYPIFLEVSTGASFASNNNFNPNLLLESTDAAMYRAKKISQKVIFWASNPIKKSFPVVVAKVAKG